MILNGFLRFNPAKTDLPIISFDLFPDTNVSTDHLDLANKMIEKLLKFYFDRPGRENTKTRLLFCLRSPLTCGLSVIDQGSIKDLLCSSGALTGAMLLFFYQIFNNFLDFQGTSAYIHAYVTQS